MNCANAISLLFLLLLSSLQCLGDNNTSLDPESQGLIRSANSLSVRLLQTLATERGSGNVLLGPGSLHVLLAMTLLGSVGSSYDELVDLLGFSKEILKNRANHERLGAALQRMTQRSPYASAVAVDRQATLRPVYQDFVRRVYNTEVLHVDFTRQTETRDLINDWVSSRTAGLVPRLLQQPLARDARLALLAASHFRGTWAQPFFKDFTRNMTFHGPNGDIETEFMLNIARFKHGYFMQHDCQILALPYKEEATMYLIKPLRSSDDIHKILQNLSWATIENMINSLQQGHLTVSVRLPKMDLNSFEDLREVLQSLGAKSMFNEDANFALLLDGDKGESETDSLLSRWGAGGGAGEQALRAAAAGAGGGERLRDTLRRLPNPRLHVDALLHSVKITVNEEGTEAASASAGVIARTGDLFYADRPFALLIQDHASGMVTFAGLINDPIASG